MPVGVIFAKPVHPPCGAGASIDHNSEHTSSVNDGIRKTSLSLLQDVLVCYVKVLDQNIVKRFENSLFSDIREINGSCRETVLITENEVFLSGQFHSRFWEDENIFLQGVMDAKALKRLGCRRHHQMRWRLCGTDPEILWQRLYPVENESTTSKIIDPTEISDMQIDFVVDNSFRWGWHEEEVLYLKSSEYNTRCSVNNAMSRL